MAGATNGKNLGLRGPWSSAQQGTHTPLTARSTRTFTPAQVEAENTHRTCESDMPPRRHHRTSPPTGRHPRNAVRRPRETLSQPWCLARNDQVMDPARDPAHAEIGLARGHRHTHLYALLSLLRRELCELSSHEPGHGFHVAGAVVVGWHDGVHHALLAPTLWPASELLVQHTEARAAGGDGELGIQGEDDLCTAHRVGWRRRQREEYQG